MAKPTKRRRSLKKVKKIRGGGPCDKANTNWTSGSNAITKDNFIQEMNDVVKRTRFLQLVDKGVSILKIV
jgi:hypothetical protein